MHAEQFGNEDAPVKVPVNSSVQAGLTPKASDHTATMHVVTLRLESMGHTDELVIDNFVMPPQAAQTLAESLLTAVATCQGHSS